MKSLLSDAVVVVIIAVAFALSRYIVGFEITVISILAAIFSNVIKQKDK